MNEIIENIKTRKSVKKYKSDFDIYMKTFKNPAILFFECNIPYRKIKKFKFFYKK